MTIELTVAWARRFGDDVRAEETFGTLTVDVPPALWVEALTFARDDLGCGFFDWLTGVDELPDGFAVVAHVYSLERGHHLLIRTHVPREAPAVGTATGVYRGAAWHERETHEMFGVTFEGHPGLKPLLLPEGFEGHPLRKEFVLAARVAKPWPGAKEPGESGHGAPSRRRMLPPGVPTDWGPAAQAVPERPARSRTERPRRDRPGRPPSHRADQGAATGEAAAPSAPEAARPEDVPDPGSATGETTAGRPRGHPASAARSPEAAERTTPLPKAAKRVSDPHGEPAKAGKAPEEEASQKVVGGEGLSGEGQGLVPEDAAAGASQEIAGDVGLSGEGRGLAPEEEAAGASQEVVEGVGLSGEGRGLAPEEEAAGTSQEVVEGEGLSGEGRGLAPEGHGMSGDDPGASSQGLDSEARRVPRRGQGSSSEGGSGSEERPPRPRPRRARGIPPEGAGEDAGDA